MSDQTHSSAPTRRTVLQTAAATAGLFFVGGRAAQSKSPNEKLNIACIGIGGRGSANVAGVKSQNIVALCDVDDKRAGKLYEQFPKARKFYDYREMFDKMAKEIDAVVVSTPDHTHFHPSMIAMKLDKHLYCEKPMAHSVWEVREMTRLAAERKLVTQLGAQRHAIENVHRVVELIKAKAIGEVTEVHSWIDGSRGLPKIPTDTPDVPNHVKWDLWLGPVAERPYHSTYCPYGWRFWWDFGTGETGNWGCHILDIPFWALDLKYPTRVEGSGPPVHAQTTPQAMATKLEFAAAEKRPAVTLNWYHAARGPDILRKHNLSEKGNNTLFIGTDGMLLCGFTSRKLYPEEKFKDHKAPAESIPDSPGFYNEWIEAIKGAKVPPTCNFDYSGPLTETVLLGNIGYRVQGSFNWDAATLKASTDAAQALIRTEFRKGWEI